MTLMPASSARWMIRMLSSWSGLPQRAEHHRAERQRADPDAGGAEGAEVRWSLMRSPSERGVVGGVLAGRAGRGRSARAGWCRRTRCRNSPRLRRIGTTSSANTSKPPVSQGGITLKPSAAPVSYQCCISSAICSGVPTTTRCPRAPASRCRSWRIVGCSRSTMSSTTWNRLLDPALARGVDDVAGERPVEVVGREVRAGHPLQLLEGVRRLGQVVELVVQLLAPRGWWTR